MSKAKTPKKPKKPAVSPTEIIDPVPGNQAAYDRFLPEAKTLSAEQIRPFRADASLAFHNISAAVVAITAARPALDARILAIDWKAIAALPDLALAVCFAASQVETTAAPVTGIAEKLAEARKLRALLIAAADALAAAALIPAGAVQKIHEGRGAIDLANDCVDLAALFRKHKAAISGKHAVSQAQINQAAEVGSALVAVLKPKQARKGLKPAELTAAVDARDRLWTLLVQQHTELRRLGAFQWIDQVDAHVPPLQARRSPRGKGAKKPAAPSDGKPTPDK